MERIFVVVGHRAKASGKFDLSDLSSSGGWVDTLIRCLTTSFCLSNGVRKDTTTYLVFLGGKRAPKTIKVHGPELRSLNSDERSAGGLIRTALTKRTRGKRWVKSTAGIYVSKLSFGDLLSELSEQGCSFIHSREGGVDVRDMELSERPCFILGDNRDLTEDEEAILDTYPWEKMSVGPISYHADHCITVIQNEIDRRTN